METTMPLFHRNDPGTSREAAEELVKSGKLNRQERDVFDALLLYPGQTSKELARLSGLDRYIVARRLPGLRLKGYAKNCPAQCDRLCFTDKLCEYAMLYRSNEGRGKSGIKWWPRIINDKKET